MHKAPYVFPIIGGRKIEHLHANIEALSISLTPEQVKALDNIVPFKKGFPYDLFVRVSLPSFISRGSYAIQGDGSEYNFLYASAGHFDKWPVAQPIRPATQ